VEALCNIDSEKRLEAMKSEIDFMYTNQVWTLVDPPKKKNSLDVNRFLRERLTWMIIYKYTK
jgi:hypothetical protein